MRNLKILTFHATEKIDLFSIQNFESNKNLKHPTYFTLIFIYNIFMVFINGMERREREEDGK